MYKKAFTLIELLVVIAIIAILAAILFPVFAQAKAAAKHAATLSNTKQLDLAVLMYTNDYDDNFMLDDEWNTGSDALCYGPGVCFSTWGWLAQPYIKNADLFHDPLAPVSGPWPSPQINFETYYMDFGYNYTYLAPDVGQAGTGAPGNQISRTTTYFQRPAETVMIAAKWANSENHSGFDWGTTFPPSGNGILAANSVDAPVCDPIPYWCLSGWGIDGFYDGTLKLTPVEGGATGGVSLRYANLSTVSWVDGHSKAMTPGALAVGSNWYPTMPSAQQQIIDYTKYLWGAVDNAGH